MSTISFSGNIDVQALAAALQPIFDARYLGQSAPTPTPTPTPTPVPVGSSWVYQNGVFVWGQGGGGDYSWGAVIDYANKVGKTGGLCIGVQIIGAYGGFQPFAPGKQFDVTPFKYLTYACKPTRDGQIFATGFAAINDVADGTPLTIAGPGITKYGPVPQANVWATYKIPLADFKLTNPVIQKLTIADGSGAATNQFFVDAMGFTN